MEGHLDQKAELGAGSWVYHSSWPWDLAGTKLAGVDVYFHESWWELCVLGSPVVFSSFGGIGQLELSEKDQRMGWI